MGSDVEKGGRTHDSYGGEVYKGTPILCHLPVSDVVCGSGFNNPGLRPSGPRQTNGGARDLADMETFKTARATDNFKSKSLDLHNHEKCMRSKRVTFYFKKKNHL